MTIIKYLKILCLVAATFLQTSNYGCILMNYLMNTSDYIANCDNINKPLMQCNGQCQMGKQMEDAQDQDKTSVYGASFFAINNHQFVSEIVYRISFVDYLPIDYPAIPTLGYIRAFVDFLIQPPD